MVDRLHRAVHECLGNKARNDGVTGFKDLFFLFD